MDENELKKLNKEALIARCKELEESMIELDKKVEGLETDSADGDWDPVAAVIARNLTSQEAYVLAQKVDASPVAVFKGAIKGLKKEELDNVLTALGANPKEIEQLRALDRMPKVVITIPEQDAKSGEDFLFRTDHQRLIDEFMRKAKQEVPEKPTLPGKDVLLLRARLIMEEAVETVEAMGFAPEMHGRAVTFHTVGEPDLVKIVDGCADLSVVTIGTLSALGVADYGILQEVDNNNLAKFGPGHSLRNDGKLIKPPNHRPAKFGARLLEQGFGSLDDDMEVPDEN